MAGEVDDDDDDECDDVTTSLLSMPALLMAPSMAAAPSLGAATDDNTPPKLPMGVRTAETMYTSFIPEFY